MTMDVERRIEKLEKQNLGLWILAGLGVLLAVAALGRAIARPDAKEIRARRISLVDETGRTRVEMREVANGKYGVVLSDSHGQPRMAMEIQGDGTPRLSLAGSTGIALADLLVFQGAPRFSLANGEGVDFFSLSLELDGSSRLELADRLGRPRAVLGAGHDGSPSLVMADRFGRTRAELGVSSESWSRLVLEGPNGSVFKAPIE